ncbi:MAG: hypothetical protein AAGA61_04280 [Pseudomonadota bacterium]
MKLRILRDSIRLRLTRSEVARIANGQTVSERTPLAHDTRFDYALVAGSEPAMRAELSERRLVVTVPGPALDAWAKGDAVAVDCASSHPGPAILVEKDFACLTPRAGGDDDDTYPHPETGTASC